MDNSDRLAAVQLAKHCDQDVGRGTVAYEVVKKLLVQKYGRPTTEEQSDRPDLVGKFSSVWHGSSTLITFHYLYIPLTGLCFIYLTYEKPPQYGQALTLSDYTAVYRLLFD